MAMINISHILWTCAAGMFIGITYPIIELVSGTKIATIIMTIMIIIMIAMITCANLAPEFITDWIKLWI